MHMCIFTGHKFKHIKAYPGTYKLRRGEQTTNCVTSLEMCKCGEFQFVATNGFHREIIEKGWAIHLLEGQGINWRNYKDDAFMTCEIVGCKNPISGFLVLREYEKEPAEIGATLYVDYFIQGCADHVKLIDAVRLKDFKTKSGHSIDVKLTKVVGRSPIIWDGREDGDR